MNSTKISIIFNKVKKKIVINKYEIVFHDPLTIIVISQK